jgi:hypothetical protein
MNPRRDKFWLLAALLFSLLVLPFLVHLTGAYVLGQYAGGGAAAFFGSYLRDLATLRWYAWVLALGPLVIVASWAILVRRAAASRG